MRLTVLSVGYPLASVSRDSAGGAEQILCSLDRALVAAGHRSLVVAPEGSVVAGTLVPVPRTTGSLDDHAKAEAHARHRNAIGAALAGSRVDLVHLHGLDFYAYLPDGPVPALATLHLPVSWYPPEALRPVRPRTWLNCVSDAQHADCPRTAALLPPIPNGIPVAALQARHAKRDFGMFLGRICPEKGVHLAIDAARMADLPLLIAGELYPYEAHVRYFEEDVRPRLDRRTRFIGPVGFTRKRRLLTAARCLLAPFLAEETSSLVAREALACGTPVVAFRRGALAEAVDHGETGFLVDDVDAMASAARACTGIDSDLCRAVAQERFSEPKMIASYFAVYERLAMPGCDLQAARGGVTA